MAGVARLGRGQPFRPIQKTKIAFSAGGASSFSISGVGTATFQMAAALAVAGVGTFSPQTLTGSAFNIAGSGMFSPVAGTSPETFSIVGTAAVNFSQPGVGVSFSMVGSSQLSFEGQFWTLAPATPITWTIQ